MSGRTTPKRNSNLAKALGRSRIRPTLRTALYSWPGLSSPFGVKTSSRGLVHSAVPSIAGENSNSPAAAFPGVPALSTKSTRTGDLRNIVPEVKALM